MPGYYARGREYDMMERDAPSHVWTGDADAPFEVTAGEASFRGLPVERHLLTIAGREIALAGVREPADLLDQPDFARRFLEEDRAPYGLELWPAACMLAVHLCRREPPCPNAIELGCGLGLVSIRAALAGWRIVATDNEPASLSFARYNAALNDAPVAGFDALDWRDPPTDRRYDRIVAADVLYQLVDHEPILACLDAMMSDAGVAILSDPNRSVAEGFDARARARGFGVEVTTSSALNHAGHPVSGRIFVLRRRPSAEGAALPPA